MEYNVKERFAEKVGDFRLPRYCELPNVGLYLEQVTKYINGVLSPLGLAEMTPSMISNYVKKGVIASPLKKQYFAEHIAYLLFVCIGKNVVSIDDIADIYSYQKKIYTCDTAYDYFCCEFENMLLYTAGLKETVDNVGVTNTELKTLLRNLIICCANYAYVTFSIGVFRDNDF